MRKPGPTGHPPLPGAIAPGDRWPPLVAAGLAALRAEVSRVRWHAAALLPDLTARQVLAPAGLGGIPAEPAMPTRVRGRPPGCLAATRDSAGGGAAGTGARGAEKAGAGADAGPGTGPGTGPRDGRGEPNGDVATLDLEIGPGAGTGRRRSSSDIADLVHRVKRGDVDAFGALYDQYAALVYRYVYYRVGSTPLAEDIVSDTFLKALRRIGSFTWQGTDIGAWFITIARNLIIDHGRSGWNRLEFPSDDILAAVDGRMGAAVSGAEESALARLRDRMLLDAVRALSPDQQECVVLRFLEGMSLRETALAMGRKENAVKALQLRAVRALARHLPPAHEV